MEEDAEGGKAGARGTHGGRGKGQDGGVREERVGDFPKTNQVNISKHFNVKRKNIGNLKEIIQKQIFHTNSKTIKHLRKICK